MSSPTLESLLQAVKGFLCLFCLVNFGSGFLLAQPSSCRERSAGQSVARAACKIAASPALRNRPRLSRRSICSSRSSDSLQKTVIFICCMLRRNVGCVRKKDPPKWASVRGLTGMSAFKLESVLQAVNIFFCFFSAPCPARILAGSSLQPMHG